jgi:hypothetical protein
VIPLTLPLRAHHRHAFTRELKTDPVAGYHDAPDALIFVMVFAVAVLVILEVASRY